MGQPSQQQRQALLELLLALGGPLLWTGPIPYDALLARRNRPAEGGTPADAEGEGQTPADADGSATVADAEGGATADGTPAAVDPISTAADGAVTSAGALVPGQRAAGTPVPQAPLSQAPLT